MISFTWNQSKNLSNQRKHGVSFEEASTVFLDQCSLLFDDPDHSDDEDRFNIIGISTNLRLCVVCHCYRNNDDEIRIISARVATISEQSIYNKYSRVGGYENER